MQIFHYRTFQITFCFMKKTILISLLFLFSHIGLAEMCAQYRCELEFVKPNLVHVHQVFLGRDQREVMLIPSTVVVSRETSTTTATSSTDNVEKVFTSDRFSSSDLTVDVSNVGTINFKKPGGMKFLNQSQITYIDNQARLEFSVIFPLLQADSIFEVSNDFVLTHNLEMGTKIFNNTPVLLMSGSWGIVWSKNEFTELIVTSSYINFKSKQKYLDFYVVIGEDENTIADCMKMALKIMEGELPTN